jgi:biopolymer transport protein ExbB
MGANMDYDRLHAITFDALYASLALLSFVLIERTLYFLYVGVRARRIDRALGAAGPGKIAPPAAGDLFAQALAEYVQFQAEGAMPRPRVDDLSNALFLRVDARLHARLWVLDTIVTAAPLLGLLGTIFGIMQTFAALSAGGISDPASVSRGIGVALQATALGIGTALLGLIGHNTLHRQADHLTDKFKIHIFRTTY